MRHGNIPQPSPTEKQNLDVVSHSALPSSSPGTPAFQSRPVLGALGRGLSGAVHQQPSRKKHAMRTLLSRGQTERKDATRLPSSYPVRPSQEEAASSMAGHPGSSWGPHPLLDLSFPRSPEEQLVKIVDIRAPLRTSLSSLSLSPFLGASAPASGPSCSGSGEGVPGVGKGCSLELAEFSLSPEWRVFCHPILNRPGSSRAGPPLYSTQESQNALDWTPSPAQAPSSTPAGRKGCCPLPRPW